MRRRIRLRDSLALFTAACRIGLTSTIDTLGKHWRRSLKIESTLSRKMLEIFADTSGWGNLLDARQAFHLLAASLYRTARQQGRRIVTTNYVIVELVASTAALLEPIREYKIRYAKTCVRSGLPCQLSGSEEPLKISTS